jgi:hypothetical protein
MGSDTIIYSPSLLVKIKKPKVDLGMREFAHTHTHTHTEDNDSINLLSCFQNEKIKLKRT